MRDLTSFILTAVKTEQTKSASFHVTDDLTTSTLLSDKGLDLADNTSSMSGLTTMSETSDLLLKTTADSADEDKDTEKMNSSNEQNAKKKPYGGRPLRFQCPDCDRRFHAPSHLKRHRLCHTSERPFQCYICKKGFLQAWHLGRHMTIHTGNKPFNCPECPKTFGSRFEMKTHYNYIHKGIKEHECPVCKKMFTLRSNLKVHMRKHTGEKPYECHVCLKKFGQRGHLQYHLRKHEVTRSENQKESVIKRVVRSVSIEKETSDYGSEQESNTFGEPLTPPPVQQRESDTLSPPLPSPPMADNNTSVFPSNKNVPLSGRLFDHTNPREIKPFVCVSCNCGFGEISSIRAHVRHSHKKKGICNEIFSCAYCCKTFTNIDVLQFHLEKCKIDSSSPLASPVSSLPPTSPPLLKSPFSLEYETNYTRNPLKRSSSADVVMPSSKRRSPTFFSPLSPGARSTTSDITSETRRVYERYYRSNECPPGCNCQQKYMLPLDSPTPPPMKNEVVQSRYLLYLEQYQKMLESHVQLMEAIIGTKNKYVLPLKP